MAEPPANPYERFAVLEGPPPPPAVDTRIAELERKLAHQRARSRMLKAELRSARQAIVRADQRDAQMERIWNTYLGRYGFRTIFTMYANMRAIAGMVGLSDAQIEACAGHLSMADVMDLAARLHPEQPALKLPPGRKG